MLVILFKEMSKDSEVSEKVLILAMNGFCKQPPGYTYFRRIYTTSSIVRGPPKGGPPQGPVQRVGLGLSGLVVPIPFTGT